MRYDKDRRLKIKQLWMFLQVNEHEREVVMQSTRLSVRGLTKKFTQGGSAITVLDGISVTFEQGKTYAITGVSGTGKSTFMHLLAGLDTPTAGTVSYNEQNLATMSAAQQEQFRTQSIGLVFQLPYLIRELSVLENIMLPGLIAGKSRDACMKQAHELLQRIELEEKAQSKPSALSGGQQQRVALARALCNKPAFLLADEPTGNLDIATGKTIVELLLRWQKEWNMGIVVSSHDTYVAERMHEQYQLHGGKFII